MAKIPEFKKDPTLEDIDKALERKQQLEKPRHYLGMSQIGEECQRKLFYSFRNVSKREISAKGIKAIEDGFVSEDVMASRLRLLPYIELHTVDPNNPKEQIGFKLLLDHFRGHLDGMIKGLKQAPLTWHVWENKAVNETKFNKLLKLKDKDEKTALENWDEIYFAQAQIYMHGAQVDRHYLTVETPGARDDASIRTNYDRTFAEKLIEKAKSIIFDNNIAPARISEKREFYKCQWCESQGVCHDGDFPLINCKTCISSEPVKNGKRKCNRHDIIIDDSKLHLDTCQDHIYNPALVSSDVMDIQKECVVYKTYSGFKFANCTLTGIPELKGEIDFIYTSKDLHEKIKTVNNLMQGTAKIQSTFTGEIVEEAPKAKAWENAMSFEKGLKEL